MKLLDMLDLFKKYTKIKKKLLKSLVSRNKTTKDFHFMFAFVFEKKFVDFIIINFYRNNILEINGNN